MIYCTAEVLNMQLKDLDKEEVQTVLQQQYPDKYVEVGEADLYLNDIEKGVMTIDCFDHPVYASTHYAYEDRLVNGNKTRYKISLTTAMLKKDKYEVIYDSYGKYFVVYKEEGEIRMVPYEDFYDMLKPMIHLQEEKKDN